MCFGHIVKEVEFKCDCGWSGPVELSTDYFWFIFGYFKSYVKPYSCPGCKHRIEVHMYQKDETLMKTDLISTYSVN